MFYFVKTPWVMKKLYPFYTWEVATKENVLYLTFDDGPHPVATPFVLDQLARYNAKATFFCIGKNVDAYPAIYTRILNEGHAVGNHTQNHLNGWKTDDETYLQNINEAGKKIDSPLFRPPYGKIKRSQSKKLSRIPGQRKRIIMWSVLSGDFDPSVSKERCLDRVIKHSAPGSIVVFHDSEKAFPLLQYVLPATLQFFSEKKYRFEKLTFREPGFDG